MSQSSIHHLSPLQSSRGLGNGRVELEVSGLQLCPAVHQDFHSDFPDSFTWWRRSKTTQGVSDYDIEFRTLAAQSGWNQLALANAFLNGLHDSLKDHMTPIDLPAELYALIALASKIDKRLFEQEPS